MNPRDDKFARKGLEMTPEEALVRMRTFPGGSYMRCPYCGCKSSTHEPDCPIEIVAAVVAMVKKSAHGTLENEPRTAKELRELFDKVADKSLGDYPWKVETGLMAVYELGRHDEADALRTSPSPLRQKT